MGEVNYRVRWPDRRQETKIYHINLLKRWVALLSPPPPPPPGAPGGGAGNSSRRRAAHTTAEAGPPGANTAAALSCRRSLDSSHSKVALCRCSLFCLAPTARTVSQGSFIKSSICKPKCYNWDLVPACVCMSGFVCLV